MFQGPTGPHADAASMPRSSARRSSERRRETNRFAIATPNYTHTARNQTHAQDAVLARESDMHGNDNESSRTSIIVRSTNFVKRKARFLLGLTAGVSARTLE